MPLQLRKGRRLGGGGGGGFRMAQVGMGRATRETEEEQMKETAVYKWQACIARRLPLREGLMRSLSSFKAPEPAAMHKETQTCSFSHTHTHMHASASLLPHAGEAAMGHYVFLCLPEHANLDWWFFRASLVGQRTCGNKLVRIIPIWAVGVSPISLFIIRLSFYFPHRQNHSQ